MEKGTWGPFGCSIGSFADTQNPRLVAEALAKSGSEFREAARANPEDETRTDFNGPQELEEDVRVRGHHAAERGQGILVGVSGHGVLLYKGRHGLVSEADEPSGGPLGCAAPPDHRRGLPVRRVYFPALRFLATSVQKLALLEHGSQHLGQILRYLASPSILRPDGRSASRCDDSTGPRSTAVSATLSRR
jgi:hypothetical protein